MDVLKNELLLEVSFTLLLHVIPYSRERNIVLSLLNYN